MAVILDYLSVYYNREKPAPRAFARHARRAAAIRCRSCSTRNACSGCHALDKQGGRPVVPRDRARATRAMRGAPRGSRRKIRQGGQGAWGNVPMPPNPGLSDADMSQVVAWLLQQK